MADADPRRAKITDEHRAEAAKLRELWAAARNLPSQAEFGRIYGIGLQPAVSGFLKGRTALSQKAAAGFAAGLGCAISDFSPRLAAELAKLTAHGHTPSSGSATLTTSIAAPPPEAPSPAPPAPKHGAYDLRLLPPTDGEAMEAVLHATTTLSTAIDQADPTIVAKLKPLFSMLLERPDERAFDVGTIAGRIAELLAPISSQSATPEPSGPRSDHRGGYLDVKQQEEKADGSSGKDEERERQLRLHRGVGKSSGKSSMRHG